MKQAHLFISGMVQGIGFRQFVRSKASELGLTGWVKNLPDGRVEAILQGSHSTSHSTVSSDRIGSGQAKEKIDQMIEICKNGPFLAEVENVEIVWKESNKQYSTFEIAF